MPFKGGIKMFIRLRYPGGSVFVDEGNIDKIKHYVDNFDAKPDMISDNEIKKYTSDDVRKAIGNTQSKNELNNLFGLKETKVIDNTKINKTYNKR